MQSMGQAKPAVGIIFDSDMGETIDTALALGMLFGFDGKNEARVAALSVSKSNLKAAAFCDAVRSFYASATNPRFRGFFRGLPIGLAMDGLMPDDTPLLTEPLSKVNTEGAPAYEHSIRSVNDTSEVDALIRNALTAQHDENAIVVLSGPATNLVKALELRGVKDLIAQKVRLLSVAGGAFPDGGPECHVKTDIAAAKKLFAEWPTPIVAAGHEVGDSLLYPASSIERDFAWAPTHPIVDAYRAHQPMPYDAPTSAMAAVLQAVRPKENYFTLSDPGVISVRDDGRTQFTPSPAGKHRYLIVDPAQRDRIVKTYTELASAKPVPRQPRFRIQQEEQQQQQQQQPK
jgi:inosine-uridine nucleoside N-ribohydrolase